MKGYDAMNRAAKLTQCSGCYLWAFWTHPENELCFVCLEKKHKAARQEGQSR